MLILIVDRNCIFILSILYISVLAGLYLGAGGGLIFEMVWALIVMCWAYRRGFYYILQDLVELVDKT